MFRSSTSFFLLFLTTAPKKVHDSAVNVENNNSKNKTKAVAIVAATMILESDEGALVITVFTVGYQTFEKY